MADSAIIAAAVLARLKTITTIGIYDADVPTAPPADSQGRVWPYAVLWTGVGAAPLDQGLTTSAALDWACQVTVAAGDPALVLPAATKVRQTLAGFSPIAGATLSDETPRSLLMQRDDDVTPARWFLPLLFGCLTP